MLFAGEFKSLALRGWAQGTLVIIQSILPLLSQLPHHKRSPSLYLVHLFLQQVDLGGNLHHNYHQLWRQTTRRPSSLLDYRVSRYLQQGRLQASLPL